MQFITLGEISSHIKSGSWKGTIIDSDSDSSIANQIVTIETISRLETLLLPAVSHGNRVIVKTSNSIQSILSMVTVWACGGVVVPVKEDMDEKAIHRIALDCNAKYILSSDSEELKENRNYKDEEEIFIRSFKPRVSGSDLALIIYTSGSTGKPKGIMLTHSNVINAVYSIMRYLSMNDSDTILCALPLSFDYGLYQVLFSFFIDLKVVLYNQPLQPYRIMKALNNHAISIFPVVPALASMLDRMLALPNNKVNLRMITNTGGHLDTKIIKSLKEKIPGVEIFPMYGLTECKRALYLPPDAVESKPGSVGIPIPGLDAAVFIADNKVGSSANNDIVQYCEARPGEVGELFIRGSTIMQHYTNKEGTAGARLIQGKYRNDVWLATGDLFCRDEDGFFYFKGRKKELIKQGAYCLYPPDIEEIFMQNEQIQMTCVVGKSDEDGLETGYAYIQLKENTPENKQEVNRWIKNNMDPNYRPRKILFIDEFPLNNNGKIDKNILIEKLLERNVEEGSA